MRPAATKAKRRKSALPASPTADMADPADLIGRFHQAHPDSYHDQRVIAAVVGCSEEKLERDRWAGKGLPFVRFGRLVRYRKRDITSVPAITPTEMQTERETV